MQTFVGMGFNSPLQPLASGTSLVRAEGAFRIEDVYPRIDEGRYPVKRIVGEPVDVWADVYRDGHEVIAAALIWRRETDREWRAEPMRFHSNDRWGGSFTPHATGRYEYAVQAWTDEYATWRHGMALKLKAGTNTDLDAMEGADLLTKAVKGSREARAIIVRACEAFVKTGDVAQLMAEEVAKAMASSQERPDLTRSQPFPLVIDRAKARYSAWYEMVPRSQGKIPGRHGTFKDCIERLPEVASMGFDVLYFTPIHPIGTTNRKGKNNSVTAEKGDPGSPYAIGSASGGHDAVHPELGDIEDFRTLLAECKRHGMEVALDFAVQCSLDHPWLKEHPNWFKHRPDGSIKYAENPPKKYEDIVNPDFSSTEASEIWKALRSVILFWVAQGVRIFRVDNPHTKPFPLWEWLIQEIQRLHPDVIFLAEAFARPALMKGLAKLGFTQSYTYFTWRTQRWELEQYLNELTRYPERDFFRPNFFVNTPDILPFHLQGGEAWMFKSRVALAATLSATYGIYNGFELLEHEAIPGKEEYLNSEKYELKVRDWNQPGNIKDYIRQLNQARSNNAALQQTNNLHFLGIEDGNVIGYVKQSVDLTNVVVTAVALSRDWHSVWLPLNDVTVLRDGESRPVVAIQNVVTNEVHPLEWGGARIGIDPLRDPAAIFRCLS